MLRIFLRITNALHMRWLQRFSPERFVKALGVKFGKQCRFINVSSGTFGSEPYLIRLGNHVTVGGEVRMMTHDGGVWIFRDRDESVDVIAPIKIGNNVFIGQRAMILPGVEIGDNCVIGAGAIVTRDIPAGYVAVGIPARCLKTTDEYWESIQQQQMHTKQMGREQKKEYLEEHFFGKAA